ncbi:hypothetical protein SUGI_0735030 [Cryptomeria japonica]|nr:hypothetical protein SUGI_0735030 [Cryptomeria japonica]
MVTWKDKDEVSPLDMAVKDNNLKLMLKLLSVSQIALHTFFDKLDSAKILRESASQGNVEFVKKILESGADPLACDEQGQTALHHASMCEDAYKARMLIELMLEKCTSEEEKKKWVIKQDDMGKTAIHVAAMKGNARLCYLFCRINEGILQIRDTDGRTALFEAVKGGYDDLCSGLINWKQNFHDDSIVDQSGLTVLHVAASEGRMRIADVFGQTALHKAAKGGHVDVIKVLLHWGAHPLVERDCDGRTVLHYVAQTITGEDGKEVAELLLKKCGSDEKKYKIRCRENNLLKTAACLGDIDLTKELLTRGAKLEDIKDQNWRKKLSEQEGNNVETVSQQIQSITEQANDQPTTSDNLGRSDFSNGYRIAFDDADRGHFVEDSCTSGIITI